MSHPISAPPSTSRQGPTAATSPTRRNLLRGSMAALALGTLQVRLPAPAGAQESTNPTADLCVLTPESTAGPYYLDTDLLREDITEGTPGLPLRLQVLVADVNGCSPLANAAVDIWHCDAQGFYSGVSGRSADSAREAPAVASGTFLRGIQLTGEDGVAEFTTIYPGWYSGRTVHIHLMVHVGGEVVDADTYDGGAVAHTGQLYFDDAVSDEVYRSDAAYGGRDEARRTRNDQDFILGSHANEPGFLLNLSLLDENDPSQGYLGAITIGVDANVTA